MEMIKDWVNANPYYVILVLGALIYELGFAKKLPILKKAFIYVLLAIGCIPLTIFRALGLPMIEAMIAAFVILIFARFRRTDATRQNEG